MVSNLIWSTTEKDKYCYYVQKTVGMSNLLPMFPLQIVVFPDEIVHLHIFEPRYRQLILECDASGMTFGIPPFLDGNLMEIGTEIRLLSIDKTHEDGKMDIRVQGVGLFRKITFEDQAPGKLYGIGQVERIDPSKEKEDFLINSKIMDLVSELFRVAHVEKEIPEDPHQFNTYLLSHHIGMTTDQEYELLALTEPDARQAYLVDYLEKVLPIARQMEQMRNRAKMNGHFRMIIPPQI